MFSRYPDITFTLKEATIRNTINVQRLTYSYYIITKSTNSILSRFYEIVDYNVKDIFHFITL